MTTQLPVALGHGPYTLLVGADGRPVWPLMAEEDEHWLARFAVLNGGGLQTAAASTTFDGTCCAGAVAALDALSVEAGRLYAHLTRRRFLYAPQLSALDAIHDLEVVVCSSDAVTLHLLDSLYESGRAFAPGLIYGRTAAELRRQVLLRAATVALEVPPPGEHICIDAALNTVESMHEREWVGAAIARGAGLLTVLTHSNGLDAPLAPGFIACGAHGRPGGPRHRSPDCVEKGWCPRLRMPLEEAIQQKRFAYANAFRARVLVWSACYGVLDAQAPLDRSWCILHQLANNPLVGALLGRWRASAGHGPLRVLVQRIAEGAPLGAALAAHNEFLGVRETGQQLALLGDPRLVAPLGHDYQRPKDNAVTNGANAAEERHALEEKQIRTIARRATKASRTQRGWGAVDRDFLELCVALTPDSQPSPGPRLAEQQLAQQCERLRDARATARDTAALQAAALACLSSSNTRVYAAWMRIAQDALFARRGVCTQCGAHLLRWSHAIVSFERRRQLLECPRCQIVADAPDDWEFNFKIDGSALELVGPLPEAPFAGVGKISGLVYSSAQEFMWPTDSSGRPVRRFHPTIVWPAGITRVVLWVMFGFQYAMLSHWVSGRTTSASLVERGANV